MILLEFNVDRGFCFRPFIILPEWLNRLPKYQKRVYLAHESCHYARQRPFPIVWVIRYFTSKKFRLSMEVEAYAFECLVHSKATGVDIGQHISTSASVMAAHYWGMGDYETIREILRLKVEEISKDEEVQRLLAEEEVRYAMVFGDKGTG